MAYCERYSVLSPIFASRTNEPMADIRNVAFAGGTDPLDYCVIGCDSNIGGIPSPVSCAEHCQLCRLYYTTCSPSVSILNAKDEWKEGWQTQQGGQLPSDPGRLGEIANVK